jgi:TolB protein
MLPDGTDLRRLTTHSATDGRTGWSPDHARIAFSRGSTIALMNADGTNAAPVTQGVGSNYYPDWR